MAYDKLRESHIFYYKCDQARSRGFDRPISGVSSLIGLNTIAQHLLPH